MNFCGHPVVQGLVTSFGMVEGKILLQSQTSFQYILVLIERDILLFDTPPQTFDKDIVQTPTSSVHADPNLVRFQYTRKPRTGEVTALIGVEDVRSCRLQGFFQTLQAEIHFQCIGHPPIDHVPRVPVDDGNEIGKAFFESDIGDVGTPDLVRFFNVQIS